MAEWSKAPDSRLQLYPVIQDDWDFWSSYEGVGSNPTSDKPFYSQLFVFVVVQLDKVHCTWGTQFQNNLYPDFFKGNIIIFSKICYNFQQSLLGWLRRKKYKIYLIRVRNKGKFLPLSIQMYVRIINFHNHYIKAKEGNFGQFLTLLLMSSTPSLSISCRVAGL